MNWLDIEYLCKAKGMFPTIVDEDSGEAELRTTDGTFIRRFKTVRELEAFLDGVGRKVKP